VTGAGGFLGRSLMSKLEGRGTETLGRGPGMTYRADITGTLPDLPGYDMVVHAAGKAHSMPKDGREESEFHTVNHKGTLNLLDALERSSNPPRTFVLISTVAVYGLEEGWSVDESHPLAGNTPYSLSKAMAEDAVTEWAGRNGADALILRLPLVVGRNAPGNLGAMERHMRRGTYLRIGTGDARRSMVLADDVAELVARAWGNAGVFNLTDRYHPSIREIDGHMSRQIGRRVRSLPTWLARTMARVGDMVPGSPFDSYRLEKLSRTLTFNDDKAVEKLGWTPKRVVDTDFLT